MAGNKPGIARLQCRKRRLRRHCRLRFPGGWGHRGPGGASHSRHRASLCRHRAAGLFGGMTTRREQQCRGQTGKQRETIQWGHHKFSCGAAIDSSPRCKPWVIGKNRQSPERAKENFPSTSRCFLPLLRSSFQKTCPTHSSCCGLLSSATPWLPFFYRRCSFVFDVAPDGAFSFFVSFYKDFAPNGASASAVSEPACWISKTETVRESVSKLLPSLTAVVFGFHAIAHGSAANL